MKPYIKLAAIGAVLSGFFLAAPFSYADTIVAQGGGLTFASTTAEYDGSCDALDCRFYTFPFTVEATTTVNALLFAFGSEHAGKQANARLLDVTSGSTEIYTFESVPVTEVPTVVFSVKETPYASLTPGKTYRIYLSPTGSLTMGAVNKTLTDSAGEPYWVLYSGSDVSASTFNSLTLTPGFFASSTVSATCDDYAPYDNSDIISATVTYLPNALCKVSAFLFIPDPGVIQQFVLTKDTIVQDRFPFSWLADLRDIFTEATATTTENFINVTLDFGTTTQVLGFTDWEVISTSTISTYLSDDTRNTMKTLLATVFYLLAAGFIYRSVQNVWHKQV